MPETPEQQIEQLKVRLDLQDDRINSIETSYSWSKSMTENLKMLYDTLKIERCCRSEDLMKHCDQLKQLYELMQRPVYETQSMVDKLKIELVKNHKLDPKIF